MTLANLASHAPSAYDLLNRMDLLNRIGLERRRSRGSRAFSRAGWIGIGLAMGGGLALLLAPRVRSEVRETIGEQARRARSYVAPHEEDESDGRGRASSASRPAARV